jgi:hypothetical protein
LFVSEGSSDLPVADLVEALFLDEGIAVHLSRPDFSLLGKVPKDVRSRIEAGFKLLRQQADLVVVHRDADNVGAAARRLEVDTAANLAHVAGAVVPVIPIRMTEAWLLLSDVAIRQVAGNPRGRMDLELPKIHEVEGVADPKELLRDRILRASNATGRRREGVARRFNQHRRQLLERVDRTGPITKLSSWQQLLKDVSVISQGWRNGDAQVRDRSG